jgi:NhaP-type Na+/H+ or K+/H+ antiporter
MLAVGMPVVIVVGTVVAAQYLALPLGLAVLLGVILAPTDAALAEPVLVSPLVPERVRQTLNVESGLNDGLAVPVLLIAIGIIEAEEGAEAASALGLVVTQLGIGIIGGLVLGWLGSLLIGSGADSGWMNPLHQKIAAVALALAGFAGVQLLGGSGFVAVFIAGGLMGHLLQQRPEYLYELAEEEGHALVLLAFFIFGVGPASQIVTEGVSAQAIVMAVLSLILLRPISIGLSLWGQGLRTRTVAFLGWFGPRGLATVVFALVALEELGSIDPLVEETIMVTVLISIVVHGLSAVPLSRWLSRVPTTSDMPEHGEAYPHPTRR